MHESVRVLHVDDDPEFTTLTALSLERADARFSVTTAASAEEGLDCLAAEEFDCVVSDYNMADRNGIEFLRSVRDRHPDLPFILFTGKGSEEIASEAISADVTDYLQKEPGSEQFELLANRIRNAVRRIDHREKIKELHRIAIEFESLDTIEAVCEQTVDAARNLLSFTSCGVSLYEPATDQFETLAAENTTYELPHRIPAEGSLAGRTLCDGSTIVVDDVADADDVLEAYAPVSVLSTPIGDDAVLQVGSDTPGAFDENDIELVELLASHAAEAIDRINRQQALKHERDRFRTLFENLPQPIVEVEYEDTEPMVREINPAFETQFGYPRDQLLDASLDQFIVPPDKEAEAADINERALSGEHFTGMEVRRQTAYGKTDFMLQNALYADESGGFAIYNNITERKARERAIQRERDRFSAIFETISEPIVHVRFDGTTPIVETINSAFSDTFGYDLAEIKDESLNEYIVPADRRTEAAEIDERVCEGEIVEREVTRVTADGPRDFLFRGVTFEVQDGVLEGTAAYIDITDLKEYERELERKNERLEEFISVVSHDLRNPLNVVEGRLDLARSRYDDADLRKAAQSLDRAFELIEGLLTLAKEGETVTTTESVAIDALATESWNHVATQDATLIAEADCAVVAERSRLQQLLENLFSNAIDHGGDDVTVTVGTLTDGFYIEDNGPGIPPADRDRIFEAGYSTTAGGNGFGLSIVERIVDAHGWTISVTDGADGGTRFEIRTTTE